MEDTIQTLSLGDIPDLSGVVDESSPEPFADGWYQGTIIAKREFTDQNGNDRVFASEDVPSQNGESRNINLQLELKRKDGRVLNTRALVNYRTEDLTQETIQAVKQAQASAKESGENLGAMFRPFMVLTQLGTLQRIAGVRQLQRNGNGGLDLAPLYGKTIFVRLGDDDRNPKFKAVKKFQETAPKKATVL